MAGSLKVCEGWRSRHDRPRYTLSERCPACDGSTRPAAPARYSPEDRYGEYRRERKRAAGGYPWQD